MTSHNTDLYPDLGVTRAASRAQITHAYRALLPAHHPDTRPHSRPTEVPPHGAFTGSEATGSVSAAASASDGILGRVLAAYAVLTAQDRGATYDHQQRNDHPGGEQLTPPPLCRPDPLDLACRRASRSGRRQQSHHPFGSGRSGGTASPRPRGHGPDAVNPAQAAPKGRQAQPLEKSA